jgi:formate hydrogenlyase subunit 4
MISRLFLHLFLLLVLSPLLPGIISRTKAVIGGRKGAPLLQPYWDIAKLLRKGMVLSTTTTWVFRVGPVVGVAVPVLACLLLPLGALAAPFSFTGDLILFVYLFGLARFFVILAALDTGSAFEGMGAAREATFSCLTEPTIFIAFVALARLSGTMSLDGMYGALAADVPAYAGLTLALLAICLFIVMLAENSRIPFDDPNTHLELTMIHEVMVLDHSGPDFGLIMYGAAMKLFVMGALVVGLLLPEASPNLAVDAALFVAAMLALAVAIGLVESAMARLRLIRVPQLLVGTSMLSLFAFILLLW